MVGTAIGSCQITTDHSPKLFYTSLSMVPCKRTATKAVNASERFIERLSSLYGGLIVPRHDFIYDGNREYSWFRCLRCESPFQQTPSKLIDAHRGCPFCDQLRPRLKCKSGVNCKSSRRSSRPSTYYPQSPTDERRAQKAAYQAKRRNTPVGSAEKRSDNAQRRLLRTNTPEYVFLDGTWQEVDRRETWRIFGQCLLPPAERKAIQELYLEAQYLTETTGIEHHVDHIQPLSKGGEHMMFNLQIIIAEENLSKGGNFRQEDQIELAIRFFGLG